MRRFVPLALAAFAAVVAPAAVAAPIEIHAHRGGTVVDGRPTFPEETIEAYRHVARDGFVLEVDAKLTRDRVPVAVHDATLDRTTNCTGELRALTLTQLRACRPDVLGSPGSGLATRKLSPRSRIPTIAEVLELARVTGAKVNLEIKNVPTDPDYDMTSGYANRVMDVVIASGLPRAQLLIQSFIPANLDVASRRLPRVATSLLALSVSADTLTLATSSRYDWISPQWPVAAGFVADAQRADLLVAPYTLNAPGLVRDAGRARVDAVITDDPLMAARALGRRPARGLSARLRRVPGLISAGGSLRPPRGMPRRRACKGVVTLRILGTKRALRSARARLRRDCSYAVRVTMPRGLPARMQATIGFGGNQRVLARLAGPRPVPSEVALAVPE